MIRVLFLAGSGRSGSTLVTTALGQLDGFFAAGELRYLWQRGLVDDRPCGCGAAVRDCPMWRPILAGLPAHDPAGIAQGLRTRLRMRNRLRVEPHPDDEVIAALYRGIAEHTGGAIIVDSSKLPPYAVLVRSLPGVDLRVVHLVRDSRGMAYSWTKAVARPEAGADRTMMHQHKPSRSAARWMGYNSLFHLLGTTEVPVTRVIYEDLVVDPRGQLDRILDGAGIDVDRSYPFLGDGWVELGSGHSVAGNPMRFNSGRLELRVDSAWRQKMAPRDRRTVTALTAPLLAAYGYLGRKRR